MKTNSVIDRRTARLELDQRREIHVKGLPERVDDLRLSARNGQGEELPLFDILSSTGRSETRLSVRSPRQSYFAVSETAVELNLFSGEKLLGTRALSFTDSGMTTVTW